ncbi:LURP-one-related family protein [Vagococcus sp. BWB3-3]|uniref:LURP-one-related family protein n=1 Tax=Vagococcus allomyrinae TaxID=2794353 RepID=A0A940P6T2_9ENTE|nr:LURP-one-related family protein [Vagococcus allomyrinae]MBP1042694.1 LURP-one-related family protein [Vagococcus allomyrinae]
MQKLYMKQKVFSLRDRFTIKDERGSDVYFVSGSIFSFAKKLYIHNRQDQEVARIEQQLLKLLPKFSLLIDNQEVAVIKKEFTFFKQKYDIEGTDIKAEGDFLAMTFSLTRHGKTIATVQKAWFSWGDSYEISISKQEDELIVLGLVLAIDFISHNDDSSASSTSQ